MTVVKCNMYCKHVSRKGNCKLKRISFDEFGNCANRSFDYTKADCVCCSECNLDDDVCEHDGHAIKETSKCTNGAYNPQD